jgi:hypothetical protein
MFGVFGLSLLRKLVLWLVCFDLSDAMLNVLGLFWDMSMLFVVLISRLMRSGVVIRVRYFIFLRGMGEMLR